jgi:hypothetical protein
MSDAYPIRSLIYVSDARDDLTPDDLDSIHHAAMSLNALDGITGLLVFNGKRFLQIVEGTGEAVEDLLGRLRRDPRHNNLWVRADNIVETRSFPDWSMMLLKVSAGRFEARDDLEPALPDGILDSTRLKLLDALDEMSV